MAGKGAGRWVWRPAVSGDALCDPSALPHGRDDHSTRLQADLWGPRYAKLCPVVLLEQPAGPTAKVVEKGKGDAFEVPTNQLLPWYEGLLVLNEVERSEEGAPWLRGELLAQLEQERSRMKQKEIFESSLYVRQRLFGVAVTGPKFIDHQGNESSFRRQPMRQANPAKGKPTNELFCIASLDAYMPPWEAFVHPRCGLYQDFYKVRWADPHLNTDYSSTENGCDEPGTTWEPDECLPDDLDQLRVRAKVAWFKKQVAREKEWKEDEQPAWVNTPFNSSRGASDTGGEQPVAKKRKYNPLNLPKFWEDMCNNRVMHSWSKPPALIDEKEIKQGWPKHEEDYPPGHAPAKPPGACSWSCTCMEDWHMGGIDIAKKGWLDSSSAQLTQHAVDNFINVCQVTRRGQFSGTHYLEPLPVQRPRNKWQESSRLASELASVIWRKVADLGRALPARALVSKGTARLTQALASAFIANTGTFVFAALQYRASVGPPWLEMDAVTGEIRTPLNFDVKALEPGKQLQLCVDIAAVHGELAGVHREVHRLDLMIDPARPDDGSALLPLSAEIGGRVAGLEPPALQDRLRHILSEVFNFDEGRPLRVPAVKWAHVMGRAGTAARAASMGRWVVP